MMYSDNWSIFLIQSRMKIITQYTRLDFLFCMLRSAIFIISDYLKTCDNETSVISILCKLILCFVNVSCLFMNSHDLESFKEPLFEEIDR